MEVDVSSSLSDSTSDQIIEAKIERENHMSVKEKKIPECGINKSDDDKKTGDSCVIDEDKLSPVEVGNSEEMNYKSERKKHRLLHENDDPDDENISGAYCMVNGTKLNSTEAKCLSGVHCIIKRVSPGKRKRETLYLNDQSKSINEHVAEVSAAKIGSNIPRGSTVDNCPSLVGGSVADSATELQGTERTRSNQDKEHSCSDTNKADGCNTYSALETICEPKSKISTSKKFVSTEISLTEDRADFGGTVADDRTGLSGEFPAVTDTILQYQRRNKNNSRERLTISDCNVNEPSNRASTFDSECTESSNNCNSMDATVTEESAVMESGTEGENKKKKMKSKEDGANEECSPKNKQNSSLSTPIRSATTIMHVVGPVTTDNVESSSSCTSDILVLKDLVPPGKKKLLILDINGLLADINQDYNYSEYADFKISGKLVFKRPFCTDFLNFCFANFEIGVWSSRKLYNVQKAVRYLMGDLRNKLLFCWDQSKCTATNFNTIDNSRKPLVFKELNKLWEKEEPDLPWEKGRFTPSNTLLVDDSPYKAFCNPPFTAIFPLPYSFKHKEDNSLGIGGDLRVYLEKVVAAEHVQYFVKDNPFGQPAITDSHPNWKFYLRIIENLDKPLVST